MKILILKFHALGDVLRTSYILPGLYEKYDDPVIDWVTSPSAYDLLRYNPYIRNIASPQNGLDFLKHNHYDFVFSFDDEIEVLKLLDDVSYVKLIGAYMINGVRTYDPSSSEWFDMGLLSRYGKEVADKKKKANQREHNQIFSDMLAIKITTGYFFNSHCIDRRIKSLFDSSFFHLGINPSAGNRWKNKEIPLGELLLLINTLAKFHINGKEIKFHILGGAAEKERNLSISKSLCENFFKNWGGDNTLLEFASIVKNCNYLITGDTLALHLAISQNVPNLSYYAPTSANEIGTFGTGIKITSLSDDYCTYRSDADNSTITAERLIHAFITHCHTLGLQIDSMNTQGDMCNDCIS